MNLMVARRDKSTRRLFSCKAISKKQPRFCKGQVMPSFKSEGTIVQQNDKTYWFKDGFSGQEVSPHQAISLVEGILGRSLRHFESTLLISRPVDGSTNITIVSMLAIDGSQPNYLKSIRRKVIGYVVRRRENAASYNYADVIGTDAFFSTEGKLLGELHVTRKQEPGLQTPLLDPIDFAGGALADIVTAGAKAIIGAGAKAISGSFREAMVVVEQRLLARGATGEVAKFAELSEEELAMVWGGGTANPLTPDQIDRAIWLLRNGEKEIHVESIGQMHQIQGELGQLGVRSQSSSSILPQRPAFGKIGAGKEVVEELNGSYKAGRGTYRVDPPHLQGSHPTHNAYTHLNITLRDGKKLAVVVTGKKSF
jgi:hypothetical protein